MGWKHLLWQIPKGVPTSYQAIKAFMRNVAIGLGNAPFSDEILQQLQASRPELNDIVQVHIDWAIQRATDETALNLLQTDSINKSSIKQPFACIILFILSI